MEKEETIDTTSENKLWEDDELNRSESAEFLTKYLNGMYAEDEDIIYKDSFVLNINAGWGFGKTFFLTHWQEDLDVSGHPTIYFDAWKNDYSDNALMAFLVELEDKLKEYSSNIPKGSVILENLVSHGKKLIKPSLAEAVSALTGLPKGTTKTLMDLTTEDDAVSVSMKSHRETKAAIEGFKKKLSELVKGVKSSKKLKLPIYILIDELDRCRPTYAIELLESIKHMFGVNGVFFILATNKSELSHSIRAVYGQDFDGEGYLRRFFDQEYVLPSPNNKVFAKYLIQKHRLINDDKFYSPLSIQNKEWSIADDFALCAENFDLALRDQIQIAHQLKATILIVTKKLKKVHTLFLIFLLSLNQNSQKKFDTLFNDADINMSEKVSAITKRNLNYTGYEQANFHMKKVDSKRSLLRTIEHYMKLYGESAPRLLTIEFPEPNNSLDHITRELSAEANTPFYKEQFYPLSIRDYPKFIKQAGHLISQTD